MLFAVCAPGLEPVLLSEVQALGIAGRVEAGGVLIEDDAQLTRVNLWLRTATRVLVRIGQIRATAFPELVRKAAALPWERFVPRGARASFHVACHKSRLYHSGGVRQRLHAALQERVGFDVPLGEDGQLFVARFDHDVCTVSVDSSGPLLHQRGWRGPQAKAPLRETLAAALLLAARYDGSEPLSDPLCGSGTIPIEAALIAQRRAPGLLREFAFQRWPEFDAAAFAKLREDARAQERPLPSRIEASDQDAGAIAAAKENAARAGVQIEVAQRRLAQLPADSAAGLIACNPPYGVRVVQGTAFRDLAEALQHRPQWRAALIVADGARPAGSWQRLARTQNGGIRVELITSPSPRLPGSRA